jgi:hypothetical protein
MSSRLRPIFISCWFLLTSLAAASAFADPGISKPVYDPASKSYFEMVDVDTPKYSPYNTLETPWEGAVKLAQERTFKGARGRLAVVKNAETHQFLLRTFQPHREVWIGMRFWCGVNQVQFVDGTMLAKGTFAAWDTPWDQSGIKPEYEPTKTIGGCEKYYEPGSNHPPTFMPIAYSPTQRGFRWIAKEHHKLYLSYLVEYPTGAP